MKEIKNTRKTKAGEEEEKEEECGVGGFWFRQESCEDEDVTLPLRLPLPLLLLGRHSSRAQDSQKEPLLGQRSRREGNYLVRLHQGFMKHPLAQRGSD